MVRFFRVKAERDKNRKKMIIFNSQRARTIFSGQKAKRDKKQKNTTTIIIFYSERAKRATKFFGNVLHSKRLRGIKKTEKKKERIFYFERAKNG